MSCMYLYSSTLWKVKTLDIIWDYLMDLHRSYRMQQCAIDNIADITVVTEQGVLKISIFKTAVYTGGKKITWKRTTSQ